MGDPKKPKKKYSTPTHPWKKDSIDYEKEILKEYGLKNKKEIWKMESVLRNFRSQAKKLVAQDTPQSKKETEQLLNKLVRLNLMNPGAKVENILDLDLKDILNRRFQTQVFKQGLARSMKQARQFITHKHICVSDKIVNVPSYLVSTEDEFKLSFTNNSKLSNEEHPERVKKKTKNVKEEVEKIEKKVEEEIKAEKGKKKEVKEKEAEETKPKTKEKPAEEKKEEVKEIKKEEVKEEPKELKEEKQEGVKEETKEEVVEEKSEEIKK